MFVFSSMLGLVWTVNVFVSSVDVLGAAELAFSFFLTCQAWILHWKPLFWVSESLKACFETFQTTPEASSTTQQFICILSCQFIRCTLPKPWQRGNDHKVATASKNYFKWDHLCTILAKIRHFYLCMCNSNQSFASRVFDTQNIHSRLCVGLKMLR